MVFLKTARGQIWPSLFLTWQPCKRRIRLRFETENNDLHFFFKFFILLNINMFSP